MPEEKKPQEARTGFEMVLSEDEKQLHEGISEERRRELERPGDLCNVRGMPFCCGIDVVGNFNGGYSIMEQQTIAKAVEHLHGIALATTVGYQWRAIKELRKSGFKKLLEFHNNVHGDTVVTLWYKDRGDGNVRRR